MTTTFATKTPKRQHRDITNDEAADMLDWLADVVTTYSGETFDKLDNKEVADLIEFCYLGGTRQFLKDGAH
jgi:hypothetical protein